MEDLLIRNLKALRDYRTDLYDKIVAYMESQINFHVSVVAAANGTLNLEVAGYNMRSDYIYSKYNPEHECIRWSESLEMDRNKRWDIIIYGLGLGYHFQAYLSQFPMHQIYIYEPNIDIFVAYMKSISLTEIVHHPNFRFLAVGEERSEQEKLFYWIHMYASNSRKVIALPFYMRKWRNDYEQFLEQLNLGLLNQLSIEQYAASVGKTALLNTVKNFSVILRTTSLRNFKDSLIGRQAIIIGSGPSLQYELETLKSLNDKAFLIAAGSSILPLMKHGIEPHLMVSMDAGEFNYNIYHNQNLDHIPMLVIPQIYASILDERKGSIIHAFFKHDPITNHCYDLQSEDPVFKETHSVTGTAIQAAIYMGCKDIILVGQDLSYPNKVMYAEGTNHYNQEAEQWTRLRMNDAVLNVHGELNPTSAQLKLTLRDLEDLIAAYGDIRFINTTRNGARITGAEWKPLTDVIPQDKVDAYIGADFFKRSSLYSVEGVSTVKQRFEDCIFDLEHVLQQANKLKLVLSKQPELARVNPMKCMKAMEKVELLWGSIIQRPVFNTLIIEWMKSELYAYDRQVGKIAKETSVIPKVKLMESILGVFLKQLIEKLPSLIEVMKQQKAKMQSGLKAIGLR